MSVPKQILVINSGCRLFRQSIGSDKGEIRLHFVEISSLRDIERIRGQVFDDVVWVRRLPWDSRDREEIEWRVNSRLVNRNGT